MENLNQNHIKWNERLKVGVDYIDTAHEKFLSVVRKLIRLNEEEQDDKWLCTEGMKFFKNYTIEHFAQEEAYMRSIHYEKYEEHKLLHDNWRNITLPALERDLETSNFSPDSVRHFLSMCISYINIHIIMEDRAITGAFSTERVVKRAEGTSDISILKEMISHFMQYMFSLDTHLVSTYYSGEDFGKSIYYKAIYTSQKDEKFQLHFVFEENLVMYIESEVTGIKVFKVSKMAITTIEQFAQGIIQYLGTYFNSSSELKLEKSNMLTKEQFYNTFNSTLPGYRLLFDTGHGYFAFCIDVSCAIPQDPNE